MKKRFVNLGSKKQVHSFVWFECNGTDLSADLDQLSVGSGAVGHHAADGGGQEAEAAGVDVVIRQLLPSRLSVRTRLSPASCRESHQAHQDADICQTQGLQPVRMAAPPRGEESGGEKMEKPIHVQKPNLRWNRQ